MSTGTGTSVPARATWTWALAATAGVLLGLAAVFWALHPQVAGRPDRAELAMLRTRLEKIQAAVEPIAASFTAETASRVIDVADYRLRISVARKLVDSTYDLPASTADAREVQDLIVTGGSQVLDAFDSALDALVSQNTTAAADASVMVGTGMAAMREARDRLDSLLGSGSR